VHFAGAVSPEDLQHLYRDADLFVLASRYEGFGMAYTEALAWALPVIATRAGAISHTLQGSGAQLVASEDTKALAKCLQALIGDSDLRAQLGLKALQFAKTQGDWQHAAKSFEQVLTEMSTESADLGQAGGAPAAVLSPVCPHLSMAFFLLTPVRGSAEGVGRQAAWEEHWRAFGPQGCGQVGHRASPTASPPLRPLVSKGKAAPASPTPHPPKLSSLSSSFRCGKSRAKQGVETSGRPAP
jgi:hypothetical protein